MPTGRRRSRTGRPDPLLAAARDLTDGREPDWKGLAAANPELAGRLELMRIVQSVASACAAPPGSGSAARAATSGRSDGEDQSLPFEWGPLRVLGKLGEGGFGEVFRAFDTVLHREVALKLRRFTGEVDEAAFQVHLEEARRLARVRHPNVLTVHGVEVHDGRVGMWTDFIRGETLEAILAREGPLPAGEVARIGLDLCAALDAVHEARLIHGDIKTANAMRQSDGRTILMDFGAGVRIDRDSTSLGASPQGTPIVMAPELIAGDPPSRASDLYAIGCVLYRLATGRHPIQASSWAELVEKHRRGEILPVRDSRPDLPSAIARAIDRCLARDPGDRPADARELAAHFRAVPSANGDDDRTEEVEAGEATAHNLPHFPTRFVGRREEVMELRRLLLDPGLVTLTGSGGCGKTRLAHRAAEEAAGSLRDGSWWVDLAALEDPALVAQTAAHDLGVPESKQSPALQQLVEFVRERSLLIVFDNCEHLIHAVRELSETLLASAPRLRILATSREPLGMPGERTLRVPSLPVPPPTAPGRLDGLEILDSEAVRLFVDRACRQRPGFAVTAEAAPAIARIVRRLDGIPLAIELAAARTGALALEQIAERLEESFRLLASRDSAVLPRQQTLLASIDWSYRLLEPDEQRCLARASVFAGGWTLEAAEIVCGDGADGIRGNDTDAQVVLDRLESLLRRSLIQFDPDAAPPRYRMLEMVRAFARERLREAGEEEIRRDLHLDDCLRLVRETSARILGGEEAAAIARLDAEADNVRGALAWTLERSIAPDRDPDVGIDLCVQMRRYWFRRERYREGYMHLAAQLARARLGNPARGRALVAASSLLWPTGDLDGARRLAEEGLEFLRLSDDVVWRGSALSVLGFLADLRGEPERSRDYLTEAFNLHEANGQRHAMATLACNIGVLEGRLGNHAQAIPHYERAMALLLEIGDEPNLAVAARNLAYSLLQLGETGRARRLAEEGIAVLRRIGQRRQLAASLSALAEIDLIEGNLDAARMRALEALHLAREAGERVTLLAVLTTLGAVAHRAEENERAARLLGAAEALHESMALPIGEGERGMWDSRMRDLRKRLGEDRFLALWTAGRALPLEDALRLTEGDDSHVEDSP